VRLNDPREEALMFASSPMIMKTLILSKMIYYRIERIYEEEIETVVLLIL
jgi:hypothetical protein